MEISMEIPTSTSLMVNSTAFQPQYLQRTSSRICVLGGSISLQQRGYRPNLAEALRRRGVAPGLSRYRRYLWVNPTNGWKMSWDNPSH